MQVNHRRGGSGNWGSLDRPSVDPEPTERIRAGDCELVGLLRAFFAAGAGEGPTLRLLRVYADSLRRIAPAEAELYESQIEEPQRRSGRSEREPIEFGARFGGRVISDLERTILDIYHRPEGQGLKPRKTR